MSYVTCELELTIRTPGDDMALCLLKTDDDGSRALMIYAESLEEAARKVREIAQKIRGEGVTIVVKTSSIFLSGPEDILMPLQDEELLIDRDEDFDEDDEDEDDEDDEDDE
jgi:hypothetical protein